MKRTIYWVTRDKDVIRRIRERFNIPRHTTVNGETRAEIADEDMDLLEEVAKRGFIQIRNKL